MTGFYKSPCFNSQHFLFFHGNKMYSQTSSNTNQYICCHEILLKFNRNKIEITEIVLSHYNGILLVIAQVKWIKQNNRQ